jgi:hypothetical protein
MNMLMESATMDLLWTLMTTGALVSAGVLALIALPWSDQEIAAVDQAFKATSEIGRHGMPVRTAG